MDAEILTGGALIMARSQRRSQKPATTIMIGYTDCSAPSLLNPAD